MKIELVIRKIKEMIKEEKPFLDKVTSKNAFKVLISCLLSLRTKDQITKKAVQRFFKRFKTLKSIEKASIKEIEKVIFPVGFYRTKAKRIKELVYRLIKEYKGKVPDKKEELLKLKGVGNKCANLILSLVFKKPEICVDTHVHRISNRLGWVKTKTPQQTERELKKVLPIKFWREINWILVSFGQKICRPLKPKCEICKINKECEFFKRKS